MLPVEDRRIWIKSRRKKRKLARQARLRRQTFRMSLLLLILLLGVLAFTYFPWALDDMEKGIEVRGNLFTSSELIKKNLSNSVYVPLYALSPAQMEHQLEKLETIKNAFVRRYIVPKPHLVVEVMEEFPWASKAASPEEPIKEVIAESGRIIPIDKFPLVPKPKLTMYAKNLRLKPQDVKQWATWISHVESQTNQSVDFIDMRVPFDVRIGDGDLYIKIGIPDTTLSARLSRLATILPTVNQYKDRLEHIDLALENNVPLKLSKVPRDPNKLRLPINRTALDNRVGPL